MDAQFLDFRPIRFSTDDLSVRDRLPAWRDFFAPNVLGTEVEPTEDVPFHADVTVRLLPGVTLWSASHSLARVSRTRRLLADGHDEVCLHVNSSSGTVCQRGREVAYRPGGAVLVSAAETLIADCGGTLWPNKSKITALHLRRAELVQLVPNLDDAVMPWIRLETEPLRYLLGYVRFLEAKASVNADLAKIAAIHLRDLFALALGATRDAAFVAQGRGLRAARLQAIKRYISDNLDQGGLTVGAVAARHRLTPRYVQQLFESEGTTFSEFVLNQRLARVFRMLTEPRYAGWNVSALALEVGFGDVSYFNRCFRRRFGASPTWFRYPSGE